MVWFAGDEGAAVRRERERLLEGEGRLHILLSGRFHEKGRSWGRQPRGGIGCE